MLFSCLLWIVLKKVWIELSGVCGRSLWFRLMMWFWGGICWRNVLV